MQKHSFVFKVVNRLFFFESNRYQVSAGLFKGFIDQFILSIFSKSLRTFCKLQLRMAAGKMKTFTLNSRML